MYGLITSIINTIPCAKLVMAAVLITMAAFYATSFDSVALAASCYSYRRLGHGQKPGRCIQLILLPIALLSAESQMNSLQSVSIIEAFPIGAVIVLIAAGFLKDAKEYLDE